MPRDDKHDDVSEAMRVAKIATGELQDDRPAGKPRSARTRRREADKRQ